MKSNSSKMIIGGIEWERSKAHITTEAWFTKVDGVKWTMKKKYKAKNWSLYSKKGKSCEKYLGHFSTMGQAAEKMMELKND